MNGIQNLYIDMKLLSNKSRTSESITVIKSMRSHTGKSKKINRIWKIGSEKQIEKTQYLCVAEKNINNWITDYNKTTV